MKLLQRYEYLIMGLHGIFLLCVKLLSFYILAYFSERPSLLKHIYVYTLIAYTLIFVTIPFFKNFADCLSIKKNYYLISILGMGVTLLLIAYSHFLGVGTLEIYLGFYILSLLSIFEGITYDKYIGTHFNSFKRPLAISLSAQIMLFSTFILVPALGGFFYSLVSFEKFLWLSFAVYPLYILVSYFFMRERTTNQTNTNNHKAPSFSVLIKKYYPILYIYSLQFFWAGGLSTIFLFFIKKSFTISQTGYLLAIGGVGYFTGNYLFLWHSNKHHNKIRLFDFYWPFILVSFFIVLGFAATKLLILPALFIGSLASAYSFSFAQSCSQDLINPKELGAFYVIRNTINAFVMTLLFLLVQYGCINEPLTIIGKILPFITRQDLFHFILVSFLSALTLSGIFLSTNKSLLKLYSSYSLKNERI